MTKQEPSDSIPSLEELAVPDGEFVKLGPDLWRFSASMGLKRRALPLSFFFLALMALYTVLSIQKILPLYNPVFLAFLVPIFGFFLVGPLLRSGYLIDLQQPSIVEERKFLGIRFRHTTIPIERVLGVSVGGRPSTIFNAFVWEYHIVLLLHDGTKHRLLDNAPYEDENLEACNDIANALAHALGLPFFAGRSRHRVEIKPQAARPEERVTFVSSTTRGILLFCLQIAFFCLLSIALYLWVSSLIPPTR